MQYEIKNITTIETGIIAHGVNCQGVMGSGVALAIKNKWPIVYVQYLSTKPFGRSLLGNTFLVTIDEPNRLFVANCYTQEFYGSRGVFASPEAVRSSLFLVYKYANRDNLPIYMPKIGAGRGGLNWENDVVPIIERLEIQFPNVQTYICLWAEK